MLIWYVLIFGCLQLPIQYFSLLNSTQLFLIVELQNCNLLFLVWRSLLYLPELCFFLELCLSWASFMMFRPNCGMHQIAVIVIPLESYLSTVAEISIRGVSQLRMVTQIMVDSLLEYIRSGALEASLQLLMRHLFVNTQRVKSYILRHQKKV